MRLGKGGLCDAVLQDSWLASCSPKSRLDGDCFLCCMERVSTFVLFVTIRLGLLDARTRYKGRPCASTRRRPGAAPQWALSRPSMAH
eukprot:1727166-Alexandrium_andersonii.AAC.1